MGAGPLPPGFRQQSATSQPFGLAHRLRLRRHGLRIRRPLSGSQGMKLKPFLLAALLALSPLLAGLAVAGTHSHSHYRTSRLGLNDAGKIADQRADADHWLEYGDRGDDLERYRELRDVAWRATGGTLDVDGGENGGVIVTGWGKDSVRVVARIQSQAETKERAQALAKAVRIVNQGGKLSAEGPDTDNDE